MVTMSTLLTIWEDVVIGTLAYQEIKTVLDLQGCTIKKPALKIFGSKNFILSSKKRIMRPVLLSLLDLDIEQGQHYTEIFKRSRERKSLNLLSAEVALYLAVNNCREIGFENLMIAMEPIDEMFLCLVREKGKLVISATAGRPQGYFNTSSLFLFGQ